MDNIKTNLYFLHKIINGIDFIRENTEQITYEQFSKDQVLVCAICFKFVQISENAKHLEMSFIEYHKYIPWSEIFGLRNRIVHDYGTIQLDKIYKTIREDLPIFSEQLKNIMDENEL